MSQIEKITHLPTLTNIEKLSLNQLSDAANRESQLGDEAFVRGLQHYKACGEYLLAAKAKGKAEIGTSFRWSVWLKENWKKSQNTAMRCMKIASHWEKITMHGDFSEDMGINTALTLASIEPETIDVEVLEKEVITEKIVTKEIIKSDPKMIKELAEAQKKLQIMQQQEEELKELQKQIQDTQKIDSNLGELFVKK